MKGMINPKLVAALGVLSLATGCASDGAEDKVSDVDLAAEQGNNTAKKNQASGYNNNWNNIGSQTNKQNQSKTNNAQSNAENVANGQNFNEGNEEPPLANQSNGMNSNALVENESGNNALANSQAGNPMLASNSELPAEEPPLNAEPAPEVPPLEATNTAQPVEENAPPPATSPATEGPLAVLKGSDLLPVMSELSWVGYDYLEKNGTVRIEMVTRGGPKYNVFQESNKANQPELIVRFYNTKMRHKLRRDIDASEFRSPVAYVRLRPNDAEEFVDVILTLRDATKPRLYAKYGNVLLTFQIPDHYFGASGVGQTPIAKAEVSSTTNILPEIDPQSDDPASIRLAKAYQPDPGKDAFRDAPANGGEELPVQEVPAINNASLPANNAQPLNNANNPPINDAVPLNPGQEANPFPVNQAQGNPSLNGSGEDGMDDFSFSANQAVPVEESSGGAGAGSTSANEMSLQQNAGIEANSENSSPNQFEDINDSDFENFDNGKGGNSSNEIDKFDVRLKTTLKTRLVFKSESWFAVGQDTGEDPLEEEVASEQVNSQQGLNQAVNQGTQENAGLENNTEVEAALNGADDTNSQGGNSFGNQGAVTQNNSGGNFLGNNAASNAVNTGNTLPVGTNNSGLSSGQGSRNNTTDLSSGQGLTNSNPGLEVPVQNAALNGATPPIESAPAPDLTASEVEGVANEAATPQTSEGGRPMKLDFRGAPLTEVIRVLSEESRVNFVIAPDLGAKKVYLSLNGVPFNDALKAVLESNALGMVPLGPNLVRIDSLEKLATDKEAEERRRKAELKLLPTKILVHRLSYAKAPDAAKMLTDMLGGAQREDKRISVQTDVRTNSVIVNAPPSDLSTVKALLDRVDLETPQVKIASRIVEVLKTFSDAFGISWGTPFNFDQGRGLGFGNLVYPNYMLSRYTIDAGGQAARTGNFNFRFGSINNSMALDAALSMEESRGTSEVLQSSNLIVEDNQDAEIIAGRSDFFRPVVANGNAQAGGQAGQNNLDEVTYNLTMQVKPHITADGAVQMAMTIESDTPGPATTDAAVAAKNNRKLTTSLLRRSGETAVIGGIYNTTHDIKKTGVPFLSSLPIIGALFRSNNSNEQKRELMVMVTPTILSNSKSSSFSGDASSDVGVSANAAAFSGGGDNFGLGANGGSNQAQDNQGNNAFGNNQSQNTNASAVSNGGLQSNTGNANAANNGGANNVGLQNNSGNVNQQNSNTQTQGNTQNQNAGGNNAQSF